MIDAGTVTYIGSISSIAGLVISLTGFAVTIYNIRRSRSAAERATQAAEEARASMKKHVTVSELSEAFQAMKEIKRLHRNQEWAILPDRYDNLRELLISIKINRTDLSDEEQRQIQGMISAIAQIEHKIDVAIERGKTPYEIPQANRWINKQGEILYQTLVTLTRG